MLTLDIATAASDNGKDMSTGLFLVHTLPDVWDGLSVAIRRPKGPCHPDRRDDGWPALWVGSFRYQAMPGSTGGCSVSFPVGWSSWSPEGPIHSQAFSLAAFQSKPPRDEMTGLRHTCPHMVPTVQHIQLSREMAEGYFPVKKAQEQLWAAPRNA